MAAKKVKGGLLKLVLTTRCSACQAVCNFGNAGWGDETYDAVGHRGGKWLGGPLTPIKPKRTVNAVAGIDDPVFQVAAVSTNGSDAIMNLIRASRRKD